MHNFTCVYIGGCRHFVTCLLRMSHFPYSLMMTTFETSCSQLSFVFHGSSYQYSFRQPQDHPFHTLEETGGFG